MGALIVPPVDVPRCLVTGDSATLVEESAGVKRGVRLSASGQAVFLSQMSQYWDEAL